MIFYEPETWLALVLASLPAFFSIHLFFTLGKKKTALFLLLTSAFLLRLVMISLDPYLYEWDERFHALVAKNMVSFPFKPMLFLHHVFPYDYKDWSYNHIWLHKQPLFLWQMALSMKIFGINIIALRLPSVIMGTIMVWLIYDIGRKWIANDKVAFSAAFFSCFVYYSLELVSGRMSTDHNDLAFLFYVTCSFWAFTSYIDGGLKLKWAVIIGVFAGLAILNKWLTGLLVYAGWGLYIILSYELRKNIRSYSHLFISLAAALILVAPWQIYISQAFPIESAFTYQSNQRHLNEDFGHPGTIFYHLTFLPLAYDYILLVFFCIGLWQIFLSKFGNHKLTISFLAIIILLFSFFSFFVSTKMPMYTYPVASLVIIISAFGLHAAGEFISGKYNLKANVKTLVLSLMTLLVGLFALKPWTMAHNRSIHNEKRNAKIYNTLIFKNLNVEEINDRIILNCRTYENIELMFFKNVTAYHFYPEENRLDSLQALGQRIAAFDYSDSQKLPDYIRNDREIFILEQKPR